MSHGISSYPERLLSAANKALYPVKVYPRDKPDQAINLVLKWHNLMPWQLAEIHLPQ